MTAALDATYTAMSGPAHSAAREISPRAKQMMVAMLDAVDVVIETERYLERRGLEVQAEFESIRAIAATFFIQESQRRWRMSAAFANSLYDCVAEIDLVASTLEAMDAEDLSPELRDELERELNAAIAGTREKIDRTASVLAAFEASRTGCRRRNETAGRAEGPAGAPTGTARRLRHRRADWRRASRSSTGLPARSLLGQTPSRS